jgi:hypothetical protein
MIIESLGEYLNYLKSLFSELQRKPNINFFENRYTDNFIVFFLIFILFFATIENTIG